MSTGVEGLDAITVGGFPKAGLYLLEGEPGVGKTTLGLQFALEGVRQGETALYVTLSESIEDLRAVAASHGWSLDGLELLELGHSEESLGADLQYTVFHPAEVELDETTRRVLAEVERLHPARLVYDSLSELRLLAHDSLRYRRQILALKRFLGRHQCTTLLLDNLIGEQRDLQLHSVAHGVLAMQRLPLREGGAHRRMQIIKLRGVRHAEGYHSYVIRTGGIEVFPRLAALPRTRIAGRELLESGISGLDALLGGGVHRGTTNLIIGPAGTGKSAFSSLYATAAAARGEKVHFFVFDESLETKRTRARGLGMDLARLEAEGKIVLDEVEISEVLLAELAMKVRAAVDEGGAKIVVLDGINGYLYTDEEEDVTTAQLRGLLKYLNDRNVVTLLVVAQHGIVGSKMQTPFDLSYLADTIIVLRFFEMAGEVGKAILVLKKRTGDHERSIREFRMSSNGIDVGEPLKQFQGILTGTPYTPQAAQGSTYGPRA